LTLVDGLSKLDKLIIRMPRRVYKARDKAIEKARIWMINAANSGGVHAPFPGVRFQNPGSTKGERIDIEVHKGSAFVL